MKTHRNFLLVIAFLLTALAGISQPRKHETPKWLSDKGSWMIESNIHTPRKHILHFYNLQGQEIYTEKVEGVRLNVKRARTKMQLKKVLEASLVAWEQKQVRGENEDLVINSLRGK